MSVPGAEVVEAAAGAEGAGGNPDEPAEGAPVVETPAEVAAEGSPEALAATEAAKADAAKAKPAEIPEETLQAAALKYANKTMAAARRAEARIAAKEADNVRLTGENTTFREFVDQLRKGDPIALKRAGFPSVKSYLDAIAAFGGEPAAPSAEDRVSALEKERAEERAAVERERNERTVNETKAKVFEALEGKPERFAFVTTKAGNARVWDEITDYFQTHGQCPDSAVWAIADAVEKDMEADVGAVATKKVSGTAKPASNGAASGTAAPGTLNAGKGLAGAESSGAPTTKTYSSDDNERRRQVAAELRAEGLI